MGVQAHLVLAKKASVIMAYKNREDQRKCTNDWYQRNKEAHKARAKANRKISRAKWTEFKASLACMKCGASHPSIIDFHHVIRDGEKRSVNRLAADGCYSAAMEETKKCIPLCANCHRILHWDETLAKKKVRKKKKR